MQKKIKDLENHIILIGFGRVGKLAAKELLKSEKNFVVIDKNFENSSNEEFDNLLKIQGDALEDATLENAQVAKAKGVIVATANSATTVFVVLSVRVLNPKLFIVARANDKFAIEKLKRAGADRVVSPYDAGGKMLANMMANPHLVDFFETNFSAGAETFRIETIELPVESKCFGKTIKELDIRQKSGANVIAIIRNNSPIMNPPGDFIINTSDKLVALGSKAQLDKLDKLVIKSSNN